MKIEATISQNEKGETFYDIKVDGSIVYQQFAKAGSHGDRKSNKRFPNLLQIHEVFQNLEAVGDQFFFVNEIKPFNVFSEDKQQQPESVTIHIDRLLDKEDIEAFFRDTELSSDQIASKVETRLLKALQKYQSK